MVVVDGDFIPEPIVTTHSDLDRTRSGCTDDEVREARIGRRCEAKETLINEPVVRITDEAGCNFQIDVGI
ncbi:hypothetical protein A8D89_33750 [Burkholderia cenocepacia]|nr:hypothetical protein A8D89_33750 [Burkholderia cenocepacia]ONP85744.1 hypothetical protein A8D92_21380 [Burkholderia cenocepacia]